MDEYTRNKMPPEAIDRIEERRREFNAAWDQEEVRQKILAAEKRSIECVNAMTGIEDPAAFMEEVRGGLDRITDLEQARRSGGPAPEDLDGLDDALAEAVTIAATLLEKMEGK